mmetsp:Transcript_52185/g.124377  ORF Transcript_52185/g.124377 Transcript_52185/m.124377 type:complete len:246 (-) Transcript_52185:118-855(-)
MMPSSTDPYYVVREELQQTIGKLRQLHEDWQAELGVDTANNKRFQNLHSELSGEICQVEIDLNDLAAAITTVEGNRERFGLPDSEIDARKEFLTRSQADVRVIKDSVNSNKARQKMTSDRDRLMQSSSSSSAGSRKKRVEEENAAFLGTQRQEQQLIMNQQDEQLSELSKSAMRLGENARAINTELKEQQVMLEELGEDIDREAEKLNFVMKRIGKLMQTNDSKQICVIIALFVIFLVLLFLVIN